MSWGATQKTTQNQSSNQVQSQMPVEPGYVSQFRQSLIPGLQKQMALAQAPIYGDAAKADYLGNLNDLANQSIKHLSSTLAGRGTLDSGAFGAGASGIEQNRFSNYAGFMGQLPGMERSAQLQNMSAALGQAMNFTGRAPTGMIGSGSSTESGTSETQSNPGLSGLVSALGGLGMSMFMPQFAQMFKPNAPSVNSFGVGQSPLGQSVMSQGSMFPGWGGGIQP